VIEAPVPAHRIEPVPTMSAVASFNHDAMHRVQVVFSDDVAATIAADDIVIRNTTNNTIVPAASLVYTYDAATRAATWTPTTRLADGDYTVTFARENVRDTFGGALIADAASSFFVLAGDADRDRDVDFDDLLALAQYFGQTGTTFGQADFDFDADTDFDDLLILSQSFGRSLFSTTPVRRTSVTRAIIA
jgi:hypothetical protein